MSKSKQVKVSIVMGIYNCEETIDKCINSILNQSYENWELIMCDDGSNDNTYKIAKRYEEEDQRIKVIKNEVNKGLAYSLNKCINISKGMYIARHDADDYSKEDRLEKQVKFLDDNKEFGFISSGAYLFDENGIWGERYRKENYIPTKYDLAKENQFIHPTVIIRKEVLKKVDNYTVDKITYRTEDYDLWFKIYGNGIVGCILSEKLYYFREDLDSYSRKKFKYRIDEFKVRIKGYRKMNIKKIYYIFAIKPIFIGIIPKKVLQLYHRYNIMLMSNR